MQKFFWRSGVLEEPGSNQVREGKKNYVLASCDADGGTNDEDG